MTECCHAYVPCADFCPRRAATDGDWMPGMQQPVGPVPREPAGKFSELMHTHYPLAVQINACWAPGIEPMRVRLVRDSDDPTNPGGYVLMASITPSNARALAVSLCVLADAMEKAHD